MKFEPFDTCPRCGEADLVICTERVHSLDGSLADDASEQISSGVVICAAGCGDLTKLTGVASIAETLHAQVEATLDRAARGLDQAVSRASRWRIKLEDRTRELERELREVKALREMISDI